MITCDYDKQMALESLKKEGGGGGRFNIEQMYKRKTTRANRSSLIHGTKYFQGHISRVLTPLCLARMRLVNSVAEVRLGCTKNLDATSTENSQALKTRSTGCLSTVITDVFSLGSMDIMLQSSCVATNLHFGLLHKLQNEINYSSTGQQN